MQGKFCQRGKICRVHLVQLRKVCGDAHPCTELTDKLDHCRCGSVRGKSVLQAHGSGNGHEPLPTHRAAAVEGQHVGQQHRIAHTVGQVVVSAQRVCHRMHHAKARVGESHACHIFGVGHHGAGGFILTVGNGPGQVLHDRLHGPVGILVRERVGVSGKRRLDGVGQRVHAGGCGELGRHGGHEVGVVHRDADHAVGVHHGHFAVANGVGDDVEGGALAAGTGGGVHRHDG